MSDRFTGDNIRLIYDTLNFSKVQKQRGLLLLIDFEKPLTLSHGHLLKKHSLFITLRMILYVGLKLFITELNLPSL